MTAIGTLSFATLEPVRPGRLEEDRRASLIFVHLALIGCLCLQRFCFFIGGAPVFFCLPIFLALVAWMMASGRAELRMGSVGLFLAFTAATIVSSLVAINSADVRIGGFSLPSLTGLLLLYAALTVRPAERFDPSCTLGVFIFYVRLCAVLGIAQYFLQFAGIRFFSFLVAFPSLKPILIEPFYNYQPVLSYGSSIMRSNGFFLLEPSTFSQILMLGVVVDFLVRREWRFLPLYGLAYVLTYAGTGLVALVLACALLCLIAPARSGRVLILAAMVALLAAAAAIVLPDQFAALAGRTNEIESTGSSAYARYMTQFSVFETLWGETRTLIGFGPGALDRAAFYSAGGGNAALKLFVDYGVLGLVTFFAFFAYTLWRRDLTIVTLFMLVNFQLGGGNLLFAPLVVLAAVLCIWSDPPPDIDEDDPELNYA